MKTVKALALLLALGLASCTKNDGSVELFGICGWPTDAATCSWSNTCTAFLADRPWAATRFSSWAGGARNDVRGSMDVIVQLNNQMQANDDPALFRVNTNDFTVEEWRLKFSSQPSISLPDFSYATNFMIPAGGSGTPLVKIVPQEIMQLIDAANAPARYSGNFPPNVYLDVELRAFGHTHDGRTIETAPWNVLVDIYDVDVGPPAGSTFDPVCLNTSGVAVAPAAVCPHAGQSASAKCP